jgi:hypothetical protein
LAFPLAHPAVVSVCVGARTAKQVETNVLLYREAIPADLWRDLKDMNLVRTDAPVPDDADTARTSDSTPGATSGSRTPIDITEGMHPGCFCS